FKKIE
ncbi:vitellogenin receptor, partial [Nephila pilipes]